MKKPRPDHYPLHPHTTPQRQKEAVRYILAIHVTVGQKEATSRARGYCTNSQMMPLKKKQSVLKRRRLKLTRMVSAGRT